jgi:hypothetical protein
MATPLFTARLWANRNVLSTHHTLRHSGLCYGAYICSVDIFMIPTAIAHSLPSAKIPCKADEETRGTRNTTTRQAYHHIPWASLAHYSPSRCEARAHDVGTVHDESDTSFIYLHTRHHVRIYTPVTR